MDILTHLRYEDCFLSECENSLGILRIKGLSGLFLPIDEIINQPLKSLNKKEIIIICSFINMVYQTCSHGEMNRFSTQLLQSVQIPVKQGKVPFHRGNLLHLITLAVQHHDSTDKDKCWFEETDPGMRYQSDLKKVCQLLLLINSKMDVGSKTGKEFFLYSQILRHYPVYDGNTESSFAFYWRWLKRYWYVYNHLLPCLPEDEKKYMQAAIKVFEEKVGLPLHENFDMLSKLFLWFNGVKKFLHFPDGHTPDAVKDILHFRPDSITSFLIDENNFKDSSLLQLVRNIAFNAEEMKDYVGGSLLSDVKKFFDRTVFRYKNYFSILDWKFFVERHCAGLFWVLWDKSPKKNNKMLGDMRSSYGNVMERYFVYLMKRIFGECVAKPKGDGNPDLVIETETHILIFEFTVKSYRIDSLYKENLDGLYADIDQFFEERDKKDPKKKQEGKFRRLNEYVGNADQTKKIIPILVTEKWMGSYELIQEMGYDLDKKIDALQPSKLQVQKPLMICLDEIEVFWSFASDDSKEAVNMFVECIESWRTRQHKGSCWFNFGFHVVDSYEKNETHNNNHKDFYNFPILLKEIEEKCESYRGVTT